MELIHYFAREFWLGMYTFLWTLVHWPLSSKKFRSVWSTIVNQIVTLELQQSYLFKNLVSNFKNTILLYRPKIYVSGFWWYDTHTLFTIWKCTELWYKRHEALSFYENYGISFNNKLVSRLPVKNMPYSTPIFNAR